MQNSFKIAISLPKEDFYKIEKIRKKLALGRSSFIDKAIRFWLRRLEQDELIKKYCEGYRKRVESVEDIKALEKESIEALKEENL